MSATGAFGPFALVVESGDGPAFLDPQSYTARSTLAWIRRIMERKEYRSLHFRELLGVEDWRANLVGLVAVAMHPRRHKFIPDLWLAIDRGSDASPQLIYLARQIDPEFVEAARERIAALSAEPEAPPQGTDEGEDDEATDAAASDPSGPARSVAALLTMLATVAGETGWTEARQRDAEVKSLLQSLPLEEAAITHWGAQLEGLLEEQS